MQERRETNVCLKRTGRADLRAMPGPMSMDDFVRNLLYMYEEDMREGQTFVSDDGFLDASTDAVGLTAYWTLKDDPKAKSDVPRFDLFAKALTSTVLHHAMHAFVSCYDWDRDELCRTLCESPYVQDLVLSVVLACDAFQADSVVRKLEAPWWVFKVLDPYLINEEEYSRVVPMNFVTDEYVLALADGIKRFNNESTEAEVWAFR